MIHDYAAAKLIVLLYCTILCSDDVDTHPSDDVIRVTSHSGVPSFRGASPLPNEHMPTRRSK
jgi:hypothetical protein